jgi:hypothetical protein
MKISNRKQTMKAVQKLSMLFLLFALTGVGGCDKMDTLPPEAPLGDPAGLTGTTWKLIGYVDVKTRELTEAEPKDCGQCYTINFTAETEGIAYSVLNEIQMNLSKKPFFGGRTKIGDSTIGNAVLFYEALETVDSYLLGNDELRFYYSDKQKYLRYKLMETYGQLPVGN